jgi:hypothetical protein
MNQLTTTQTSVLARLRALSPQRSLDERTAVGIAERQANLLLRLGDVTTAPVSVQVIARLPRMELSIEADLPASGASYWTGQAWRLEAAAADHAHRQRFTFCHEYKHVIDHVGRDLFYASHDIRERVADHFAGCVLMPRMLVTRAWCSGEQNIDRLADQFAVSVEAMTRRLMVLGLVDHRPVRPIFCTRGAGSALRSVPGFAIAGGRAIGDTA